MDRYSLLARRVHRRQGESIAGAAHKLAGAEWRGETADYFDAFNK
jgi:hypothetical protein